MRNTPPKLPIEKRETSELVEELCLALRDVGVWDYSLPDDERTVAHVEKVQSIHAELSRRGANLHERVSLLSAETSWQMDVLLQECLQFPDITPYVRESDGIRRAFRCPICSEREVPDRIGVWLCDVCLADTIESFESKIPLKGLLLFRTYNKPKWCEHADAETILMTFDDYDVGIENGKCKICLLEEQKRRENRL